VAHDQPVASQGLIFGLTVAIVLIEIVVAIALSAA
jgi:hypothetical protein